MPQEIKEIRSALSDEFDCNGAGFAAADALRGDAAAQPSLA
jgi:hypothetical protein